MPGKADLFCNNRTFDIKDKGNVHEICPEPLQKVVGQDTMNTKYRERGAPMEENAYGKINLGLSVGVRRPDGYHQVDTILQRISLADRITLEAAATFSISSDDPTLPCDASNLMVKAAKTFQKCTGQLPNVHLHVGKKIFMAAGLAGGSADAAAVLRLLNRYCGTKLGRNQLEQMGAEIGSDVPFCLYGGTQRGRGRGDELTPLKNAPDFAIVLIKPRYLSVSTAWAYQAVDRLPKHLPSSMDDLEEALNSGQRDRIFAAMKNDLELVTLAAYPEIGKRKAALLQLGAEFAMMSGSGPTVFGIFPTEEKAWDAVQALTKQFAKDQVASVQMMREG